MNRTTGTSALALVAVSLGAVLLLPAFSAPKTGTTIDSPKSLAALFRSDQDRVLPGLPPAPERAIYGVRDKIVSFDPAAFPAAFLEALGPQDLGDGIVVYACKAFEDPKSREAVFLNASNKEIWREPAPEGYDPLRYLRSIDPKAVEADTKQAARLRAIYDPSRIVCSYVLASNDGADAYVRKLAATEPVVGGPWGATPRATFVPAARRPAGRTMNSSATIETPTLASLAFVPQGVDLTVSLPESFAGRVGLSATTPPSPCSRPGPGTAAPSSSSGTTRPAPSLPQPCPSVATCRLPCPCRPGTPPQGSRTCTPAASCPPRTPKAAPASSCPN
jgi:hypothetical protein